MCTLCECICISVCFRVLHADPFFSRENEVKKSLNSIRFKNNFYQFLYIYLKNNSVINYEQTDRYLCKL